jgi:hypothetical protein
MMRTWAFLACLAPALASAYCIHNDLQGREVQLVREASRASPLDIVLRPGEKYCCNSKDLDCNPEGKITASVGFEVTVLGTPAYRCGAPDRFGPSVKVTGSGTARVVNNPRKASANPYVVRVRTQDRDVSGPSGLACNESKPKGN